MEKNKFKNIYLGGEQEWSVRDFMLRSSQLTDLTILSLDAIFII